jgi:hypothetical protein
MAEVVSMDGVRFENGLDLKSFLMLPLLNTAPTSHLLAHHCSLPFMRFASGNVSIGGVHLQTQFWHPAIAMSFCTHSSAICIQSYGKFMVQLWHIFA